MIVLRIMMMRIFWLKILITFKSLKKSDYEDAVKDRERELDLNIEDCKLHCIDCIELIALKCKDLNKEDCKDCPKAGKARVA